MFNLFLAIFLIGTSSLAATNLDLNDVSVLLPLPTVDQWDSLPKGDTLAEKGILLPAVYYKKIPALIGVPTNDMLYKDFRVVGLRFDPCFHEGTGPVSCKTQIRMVWQPLENVKGVTSTLDVSLHVFYDLTSEEFKEFITAVSELKNQKTLKNEFLPLAVNPFIKAEGLQSDYYKNLMKLVYKYVGEKNLTRITFMQLFANGVVWDFGGFDIANEVMTPITIARVQTKSQRFINTAIRPRPVWFNGGMIPAVTEEENVNIILKDSRKLAPENEEEIIAAARAANRFENPSLHNPGTVDCVSCHVAQATRNWVSGQYPWLDVERLNFKDTYASDRNLNNFSPMQIHTNIVRSFGYFMNRPVVSQRTINESAEVIKALNLSY